MPSFARIRTASTASSRSHQGDYHALRFEDEEAEDCPSFSPSSTASSPIRINPEPASTVKNVHYCFGLRIAILSALGFLAIFAFLLTQINDNNLILVKLHGQWRALLSSKASIIEAKYQQCMGKDGFTQGQWIHRPNASRPYATYQLGNHYFGRAEMAFREQYPLEQGWDKFFLPWNQYDWVPSDPLCQLPTVWNKEKACELLAGPVAHGNVLFVGDSMTFTHAESLVMMLGGKPVLDQLKWTPQHVCQDSSNNPGVIIHFIRNDAVYTSPIPLTHWKGNPDIKRKAGIDFKHNQPWTPYLENYAPGLVVLNLGLHIHDLDFYHVLVDDLIDYLQTNLPHGTNLVFRTTTPGHPDCWDHTQPIPQDSPFEPTYEGRYRDIFTWNLIEDFNQYLQAQINRKLLQAGAGKEGPTEATATASSSFASSNTTAEGKRDDDTGLDVMLLDAEALTRRRADGHVIGSSKDCLHYHLPGVPDWWNRVMIEILQTKQDHKEEETEKKLQQTRRRRKKDKKSNI